MGEALAYAIPIGLAMALSPFPIIGIVLILAAPGGLSRGTAFLAGALVSVGAVAAVFLAVESRAGATEGDDPATWVSVLTLVIGVLLLLLAYRKWTGRPAGDEPPGMPKWMEATQSLTAAKAAGMGVLLSGLNPKNLVLIGAAATGVAGSTDDAVERIVALAAFVAAGCAGVAIPVLATALLGERAAGTLGTVREWMLRHNTAITVVILVLIAAKLVSDAVGALAG